MGRISPFGPAVIGEEAARINRQRKVTRADKFGPAVLGNPVAADTKADPAPVPEDVAEELRQRPEKVVSIPPQGTEPPPPADTPEPETDEPEGTDEAEKTPPPAISIEEMRKALEVNPAAFDEFFLGEMNRKPAPRKGALHVLREVAEKFTDEARREEVLSIITLGLSPAEGG